MYAQGAKVKSSIVRAAVEPSLRRVSEKLSDAYVLATMNKHKPWARRWLKANHHWF